MIHNLVSTTQKVSAFYLYSSKLFYLQNDQT